MTKQGDIARVDRRNFLRTGIIGGAGLVAAQFAAPREARAQLTTWMGQVGASSDDAWQNTLGLVHLSDTIDPICESGTYGGFRFTNVTVPYKATIAAASVAWYCENGDSRYPSGCDVYMQAADNPPTFQDNHKWLVSRATTTNYGGFSDTTVTGWVSSTDISAAVQEVVNRAGWVSGNAMCVLTVAPAGGPGSPVTVRMWDFNNGGPPNYAAVLTIQY